MNRQFSPPPATSTTRRDQLKARARHRQLAQAVAEVEREVEDRARVLSSEGLGVIDILKCLFNGPHGYRLKMRKDAETGEECFGPASQAVWDAAWRVAEAEVLPKEQRALDRLGREVEAAARGKAREHLSRRLRRSAGHPPIRRIRLRRRGHSCRRASSQSGTRAGPGDPDDDGPGEARPHKEVRADKRRGTR
jgi:hypothetical protein